MTKNIFILILVLGILHLSNGQNDYKKYYKNINRAELSYDANRFEKSAIFYERAFNEMLPFSRDIDQYLNLYLFNHYGKENIALKYAHILAQRDDLWPNRYINIDDTIFKNKLQVIKDTTSVTVNPLLKQTLDSLLTMDQTIRKNNCSNFDEMARPSAIIDSANMETLVHLFQQYGSVNESNAGNKANLIIQLIYFHNSKTRNDVLPFHILENAVKQGTFDARSYIKLYDDCMTWRSESKQCTGTKYGTGFDNYIVYGNTLFIYPPANIREINKNRKSLGIGENYNDFEKKLISTFMNCGAGFVIMNTATSTGKDSDEIEASQYRKEIDSGKVRGKYVTREIDCDDLFITQ